MPISDGWKNLISGRKVKAEHREPRADLEKLDVDEFLIWKLEKGEKFGPAHSVRNTVRNLARRTGKKFKTMQHKKKVYVMRVE